MENIAIDYSLDWLKAFGCWLDEDPHTLGLNLPDRTRNLLQATSAPTVLDFLIEHLLKIRSKNRRLTELIPNRAQAEYSRRCTERNIILKARQLGMTTYIAARFFIKTITQPGTVSLQVAHDMESAEDIFRIVHRFRENLPEEMRHDALRTSRANVRQIAFPRLDSEYRVATAADEDAGRGTTIHNLHCSEVARWPGDPQETLVSLRAAVPEHGQIVLESTPNGTGGLFYEEWQKADETGYTKHFFPWWYEDAYRLATPESALGPLSEREVELRACGGLELDQIAWRRSKHAQLRKLAVQEYPEDPTSCFRASGECVFDLELIDEAIAKARPPILVENNERWKIWLPAIAGGEYLIGVDPAGGGVDGDYCCAEVIERKSGLQCAELHGHFQPRDTAQLIVTIAKQYNDALLVVEQNNHGHAVLACVQNLDYEHLYPLDSTKQPGWVTTRASKPAMIETLNEVLNSKPGTFQSQRLLEEFRTFVRHPDGSCSAQKGAHDDCVMAMGIALAAREKVLVKRKRKKSETVKIQPESELVEV